MAGQVIVKTEHSANSMLPVARAQMPDAFARLPRRWFRVLNFFRAIACGTVKEDEMKLYMFFILIDVMILLAYPFIFIASKLRKFFGFKR